jgi:hypothetical protein
MGYVWLRHVIGLGYIWLRHVTKWVINFLSFSTCAK